MVWGGVTAKGGVNAETCSVSGSRAEHAELAISPRWEKAWSSPRPAGDWRSAKARRERSTMGKWQRQAEARPHGV